MKVIGINGSPRKAGNTEYIIKVVFERLEAAGIETEMVQIGGDIVRGCTACGSCGRRKDGRCIIAEDGLNELMAKLAESDGVILGSPTYFSDITPEMKAFMDRAGMVSNANGGYLRRKAGAAVTAVRRGGAAHSLDSMNHWLHYQQTYMVGSSYWNMVYCRDIGEAQNDEEGMRTMRTLGDNMAYLLQRLKGTTAP
jgi:multimeric flavodoxin WrbA